MVTSRSGFAAGNATAEQRVDTADRIWRTIVDRYYDPAVNGRDVAALRARTIADVRTVADDAAFYAVLKRDVHAVGDSHTAIFSPVEVEEKRSRRGIRFGLNYDLIDARVVVTDVEPGFSASETGVRIGMIIEPIDGMALDAVFFDRAVGQGAEHPPTDESERTERVLAAINELFVADRAEDVSHRLTLLRGDDTRWDARLVAHSGDLTPQVTHRTLRSGVGVLRIPGFDDASLQPIRRDIAVALVEARALIVDLRGNPGGTDPAFRTFLGELIDRPMSVLEYLHRPSLWWGPARLTVRPASDPFRKPLAVLIDGGTGSAAEMAALVLADQRAAVLVGSPTCGCVVGVIGKYVLPDGAALSVAEVGFRSAKGRRLEGDPLKPDLPVTAGLAALRAGRDVVVETAEAALLAKTVLSTAMPRNTP
jgi:carboxyl-terminal processing protease